MISWVAAASICMVSIGSAVTVQAAETGMKPVYTVVIDGCEHGTVKLDKEDGSYSSGEKVHAAFQPEDGYVLSGFTVNTESEQTVETEEEQMGISFVMPVENIRLSVIFMKETEVATEALTEAVTRAATESETEAITERVTKPETEVVIKKAVKSETEALTEKDVKQDMKTVTEPETSLVTESETQVVKAVKSGQGYTKTFKVATTGGRLKILDSKGNVVKELSEGETLKYEYPSSDSPEEVTVLAVAKEGYVVDTYVTKWSAGSTEYAIPESLENINKKEYTRGHFLASADFDETFEVSFVKNDSKRTKSFAAAKISRDTGDIDNPKVGDTFAGVATVYYDGHPNIAYNGTGYIVCNDGAFKGDSITMSTCASGHDFAAPQTGQTGSYTITITDVDTKNGIVTVSVHWKNDSNTSGYQNLSGTYSYEQNFDGTLKVSKTTTDPEFTIYNYTPSFKKNMALNATFGVYSDRDATQLVKKVKTDANGDMVKEGIDLETGTYFVQEIIPPKGFALNSVIKKVTLGAGSSRTVTIKDSVLRAKIIGKKIDALTGTSTPTSGLSLAGAIYGVFEDSACIKRITTGTTDKEGNIVFERPYFAYGTYFIKELTPPTGYELDGKVYKLVVDENLGFKDDSAYRLNDVTFTSVEAPLRGKAQIIKVSSNKDISEGNKCYSLEGCKFKLTNMETKEEVPEVLVTNADGKTQMLDLTAGLYSAKEIEAPKGFFLNPEPVMIKVESGKTSVINFVDEPSNDPVLLLLKKIDADTGMETPTGKGELSGAEYTFKYYDGQYASERDLDGIEPTRTWVLATDVDGQIIFALAEKVSGDEFYTDETGIRVVPIGTITVQESKAPTGYKLNPKLYIQNIIAEEFTGDIIQTYQTVTSPESIKRGDLKGIKVSDGDLNRMAGVPFKITSATTKESHIVVTDKNGQFNTSSSWNPHTQNTNRGETAEDGVWFGDIKAIDNSKGALPYDDYEITEMPCEANADKVLLKPFRVTISKDSVTVDLGTITNDYKPKPEIGTTATDAVTGGHEAYAGETTIIDKVEYTNLSVGLKYILKGILMDQATGKALLVNGKEVTAETSFIPEKASGTAEVKFTFDSSLLKGKSVVVFESLYQDGKEIAVHTDIADKGQTVTFIEPKISTTATDKTTGEHEANVSSKTTIIDVVKYENLIAGKEYHLKGILMNQSTGKALLVDGKQVTSETTFMANNTSGTVEMKFTFDSSALQGTAVVVFENLYYNKIEIATHADIEDKGQTVTFTEPKIGTKAADAVTGGQEAYAGETTIIDSVSYEGLLVGSTYTLKGILMDKSTQKALLVNGKEVTAETTFTAEKSNGTAEVKFSFDSSALKGKSVVAFEDLYSNGKQIATHSDINDKGQTIIFKAPEIGTKAREKDTGKKEITDAKKVTIVDQISYKGLIAGEKYTVKGILMDKSTGEALKVKGKEVTAETTFTAEKATGTVEVEFSFDATDLKDKSVVVFENLYYEGKEIATHSDIKDKAQTVKFVKSVKTAVTPKPTGTTKSGTVTAPVKTGDTTNILLWVLLAVISLSSAGITGYLKFKKKKPA
ncbi:putative outer membrane protein [Robinsoniella peoriensis]|uniref:Putative outer membrane protein n=2 Tax=Robinsoniella peoriensis TaxID=180332 RepID=A0A4U8Q344_9FIRM|nr:putative outer membrane protein [Robinsoniella peoriensis]